MQVFEEYMQEGDFLKLISRDDRNGMSARNSSESLKYLYDSLGYTSSSAFVKHNGKSIDWW